MKNVFGLTFNQFFSQNNLLLNNLFKNKFLIKLSKNKYYNDINK